MSVSHAHRLHIALPPQHTYGHIHTFSLSHTHKISIKKTRAHLKRPNPNKHELELNSNIWKYCSVKNFPRKKKLSNIRGLFSHTQKGSVDVSSTVCKVFDQIYTFFEHHLILINQPHQYTHSIQYSPHRAVRYLQEYHLIYCQSYT